jgi:DNA-binding MarR family transcriptional regulator
MDIVSMYTITVSRPTEHPTTGYLLWRLATKLRAAVDRILTPLGLSHAQYTLLASLYGYSHTGAQPSQRELADWTGLEPIFVSKLARALEQAGLIERTQHPADPRAVQLRLTDHGADVAQRAIAIVHAFQEEFTAPIGGSQSQRTRDLVRTLQTLLDTEDRSDPMPQPATLTGQDVGEAEGALTALLDQLLAGTNTGITRPQYIALRVLGLRGPAPSPAALHDYLASQPQLGLDRPQVAELFHSLEATKLAAAVAAVTKRLYADLDPDDLATAHRILVEVTERANRLRDKP